MSDKLPENLRGISDFLRYDREHGHGHVLPRDDGLLARCGGPAICDRCGLSQEVLDALKKYHDNQTSLILYGPIITAAKAAQEQA